MKGKLNRKRALQLSSQKRLIRPHTTVQELSPYLETVVDVWDKHKKPWLPEKHAGVKWIWTAVWGHGSYSH
jgi:hypothetical protein